MNKGKTITIYTDGGSRGNPGPAAYGYVISENGTVLHEEGKYIGIQTNNYAEYTAVIEAFKWVRKNITGPTQIHLFCDSLLVASQLSGKYKVKHPAIKQLVKQAKGLESFFNEVIYEHIRREKNKEADKLVNLALDKELS